MNVKFNFKEFVSKTQCLNANLNLTIRVFTFTYGTLHVRCRQYPRWKYPLRWVTSPVSPTPPPRHSQNVLTQTERIEIKAFFFVTEGEWRRCQTPWFYDPFQLNTNNIHLYSKKTNKWQFLYYVYKTATILYTNTHVP